MFVKLLFAVAWLSVSFEFFMGSIGIIGMLSGHDAGLLNRAISVSLASVSCAALVVFFFRRRSFVWLACLSFGIHSGIVLYDWLRGALKAKASAAGIAAYTSALIIALLWSEYYKARVDEKK